MLTGDILRRSAALFPEKAALLYDEKVLTYREFNNRVNCLASSILKFGFKKGDRLAVFMHNCVEYFEIYFAAAKIGGIFVPINNTLKPAELKWIVDYVNPRYFFFDSEYITLLENIEMDSAGVEYLVSKGAVSVSYVKPYESLLERGTSEEPDPK
jgi:acyl-CoA synthetase (AMP-forming)/AMP-acid ligase II